MCIFYVCISGLVLISIGWDKVGPDETKRYPKVPRSTSKHPELYLTWMILVTKNTSKYPKVPQSTQKYLKVTRGTPKYPEQPQITQNYLKVPQG